jgi:hypothetical protein
MTRRCSSFCNFWRTKVFPPGTFRIPTDRNYIQFVDERSSMQLHNAVNIYFISFDIFMNCCFLNFPVSLALLFFQFVQYFYF